MGPEADELQDGADARRSVQQAGGRDARHRLIEPEHGDVVGAFRTEGLPIVIGMDEDGVDAVHDAADREGELAGRETGDAVGGDQDVLRSDQRAARLVAAGVAEFAD